MPVTTILLFWLILTRITGMVMTFPILESRSIPGQVKIGFSIFLSLIVFPLVANTQMVSFPIEWMSYLLAIGGELILGITLGYSVKLLFIGIQLAGQIIGMQMGLSMARVIDPQSGVQVTLVSNFKNLLAILIFLSLDAHYGFLKGLVDSFSLVPLTGFSLQPVTVQRVVGLVGDIFLISLKVGAPIIGTLLLTQIALGVLMRLVPQINIFMLAFPLKIGIGLIMLGLCLPYFLYFLRGLFFNIYQELIFTLQTMGAR